MTKAEKKRRDARINRAYGNSCSGMQINIMDIGKVFREGERLIDAGADDITLGAGLRAFTEKIAVNV